VEHFKVQVWRLLQGKLLMLGGLLIGCLLDVVAFDAPLEAVDAGRVLLIALAIIESASFTIWGAVVEDWNAP
jgi:hypothetical protein